MTSSGTLGAIDATSGFNLELTIRRSINLIYSKRGRIGKLEKKLLLYQVTFSKKPVNNVH